MDPKELLKQIRDAEKTDGPIRRSMDLDIRKAEGEGKEGIYEMSFSSEYPVERWWGREILDHDPKSVRLKRLQDIGSLLFNHNMNMLAGAIVTAKCDKEKKRCVAEFRFSPSAFGQEKRAEVDAKILRTVSVGYMIHEMVLESMKKEDEETYRITDWEPYEISLCTIPADPSVGVGRSINRDLKIIPNSKEEKKMDEKELQKQLDEARKKGGEDEMNRVKGILSLVKAPEDRRFQEVAQRYAEQGRTPEEFGLALAELRKMNPKPVVDADPNIGMGENDLKRYSLVRAMLAMADRKPELAGFEMEISQAVAKKMHKSPRGFFVPFDVMSEKRDITKGGTGGYTVATDLLAASFVQLLRNKMMVRALGAQVLGGLVGDIAIPKHTIAADAYWVAENTNITTESTQVFGQIAMTPRTLGAYTDISRKLLIQSSIDVENFVRVDLATVLALAIDLAAINGLGSGSNQPTGILQTGSIGAVAIGTNGGAPTFGHIVDLETEVSIDNADVGSLAYLTNAKVRGKLKKTFTNATYGELPVWGKGDAPGFGDLNGYRAAVSNQVPSTLTKNASGAVCSAIIFGNWADYIIAEWGFLDILVDPYTGGLAGTVRVITHQDVDGACRRAESFAAIVDATTT